MNWLILYICLSSGALSAKDYWKHSEQQGLVGACHAFATVALVEAEYWRTTGKFINLSERDLFLRHYSKSFSSSSQMIAHQLKISTQKKLPKDYNEAGHIDHDFALAKKYGIASERELPYNPLFSNGVAMAVKRLRHQRDQLATEASQLKKARQWSDSVAQHKIQQSHEQLKGINKALALPNSTHTRDWTRKWLANYKLRQLKPKTSTQAKSLIISQLTHRPVAVDVTNFTELSSHAQYFSSTYSRHSLVVSHYKPTTDQFTIRSSTHKGSTNVSADALSRGTYQLYYLVKNKASD
ncbi:C1 family peptidase [Rubritalea profundi]|uniref:Peptidase C1A papain C-terminal domain-containing protein n=1 Tax=Rubritalea profundi TaxID=1658618 RepID=A0A2S7TYS6_9BACT|nr:C1 family peptidase [Rubritalea profundi]PQJ27905.1 hypothetical protein BSZ32_04920 [Rubritalea profundi]